MVSRLKTKGKKRQRFLNKILLLIVFFVVLGLFLASHISYWQVKVKNRELKKRHAQVAEEINFLQVRIFELLEVEGRKNQ